MREEYLDWSQSKVFLVVSCVFVPFIEAFIIDVKIRIFAAAEADGLLIRCGRHSH